MVIVRLVLVGAAALGLVSAALAQAQLDVEPKNLDEYIQVLRGDIQARKVALLKGAIDLTDAEAKVFWPIQKEYDAESANIAEARLALIKEYDAVYAKLTPEKAVELAEKSLQLDEKRDALRRRYFDRIRKEVSPIVAVQFLQLQRQFETMVELKIQTYVPLAMRSGE